MTADRGGQHDGDEGHAENLALALPLNQLLDPANRRV